MCISMYNIIVVAISFLSIVFGFQGNAKYSNVDVIQTSTFDEKVQRNESWMLELYASFSVYILKFHIL